MIFPFINGIQIGQLGVYCSMPLRPPETHHPSHCSPRCALVTSRMVKLHTSLSGTWPKTSRPRTPWGFPGGPLALKGWDKGDLHVCLFFYGGGWKVNALFGPSFWDFLGAEKGSGYVIICFLTEQFLHLGGPMVNSILSRPTYASVFEIGWRLGPWFIYHQWKGANDRLCVSLTVENLGWNKMAGHPDWLCKTNNYEKKQVILILKIFIWVCLQVWCLQTPWLISNFLPNLNNLVYPDFWTFPNHTISLLVAYPIISTWLSHYISISWLSTSIIRYSTISPYNWF